MPPNPPFLPTSNPFLPPFHAPDTAALNPFLPVLFATTAFEIPPATAPVAAPANPSTDFIAFPKVDSLSLEIDVPNKLSINLGPVLINAIIANK